MLYQTIIGHIHTKSSFLADVANVE